MIDDSLPEGVSYHPEAADSGWLIRHGAPALLEIRSVGAAQQYEIYQRQADEFTALFSDDYLRALMRGRRFDVAIPAAPIYAGARHGSEYALTQPKLPNLTVVPNIVTTTTTTRQRWIDSPTLSEEPLVFGCTMGHWHAEAGRPGGIQEVYEFLTYGLLLIDQPRLAAQADGWRVSWDGERHQWVETSPADDQELENGSVELWVAKPGDKVAVPEQCHMTLYNLNGGRQPLITLDFANPTHNHANKALVGGIGPLLLAYYQPRAGLITFKINEDYYKYHLNDRWRAYEGETPAGCNNRRCLTSGLQRPAATPAHSEAVVKLHPPAGLDEDNLGQQLYEQLLSDAARRQFRRFGITVRAASPDVNLAGLWVRRRLSQATQPDTPLYRHFFGDAPPPPPAGPLRPLHEGERAFMEQQLIGDRSYRRPWLIKKATKPTPLCLLVEGTGAWTEDTYVPVANFLQTQAIDPFPIIYFAGESAYLTGDPYPDHPVYPPAAYKKINDFRSRGNGDPYLDKSYARHRAIYDNLAPDVVCVATPDSTHADISLSHVERGGVSVILVEKPFDALLSKAVHLHQVRQRHMVAGGARQLLGELKAGHWQVGHTAASARHWQHLVAAACGDPPAPDAPSCQAILAELRQLVSLMDAPGRESAANGHRRRRPGPDEWEPYLRSIIAHHRLDALDYFVTLLGLRHVPEIYALDHYRYYVWRLTEPRPDGTTLLQEATDWLGGRLARATFALAEVKPVVESDTHVVGRNRVKTLANGMIYDLLPHGLALLAYFGDLATIDDLRIRRLGRYRNTKRQDHPFDLGLAETFAELEFTMEDYSGSGRVVPCLAWVGKGLATERKFLCVEGLSGRALLFALSNGNTYWRHPVFGDRTVAEHGIYFLDRDGNPRPEARRVGLDRDRYQRLMLAFWQAAEREPPGVLPLHGGLEIVRTLERWQRAQQDVRQRQLNGRRAQLDPSDLGVEDWRPA